MTTTHTPGPWTVCEYVVRGSNHTALAKVYENPAARMANAALIAAAPEMLEALKLAEECVRQAADYRQIPEEDRAALHMIRAAIAKAEGRA